MRTLRRHGIILLLALTAAVLAASQAPAPARVEAVAPTLISTGIPSFPVTTGEVFFDETFNVEYAGGIVVLSNNSDGTGAVAVDDEIIVTVTRPDSTSESFSFDYSNGCTAVSSAPPHDITSLFQPGNNQVRVQFRDVCGAYAWAKAYWLVRTVKPAEEELAAKYAPILYLVEQSAPCDSTGDPYDPEAVEIVLGNPQVNLIGGILPLQAPTAADLFGKGGTYYLDLAGSPRIAGCIPLLDDYESDYRALKDDYAPIAYAHIVPPNGPGIVALQYWFFYYFNDWNNTHEGDWEMIQLLFQADTVAEALNQPPWKIGYSQHGSGESADWANTSKVQRDVTGNRPIVYVAKGSHANYFHPGDHIALDLLGVGLGCDRTSASAQARRVDVVPVVVPSTVATASDPFAWLDFQGFWGQLDLPLWKGPKGPNAHSQWSDPVSWQDDLATYNPPADDCPFPVVDVQHVAQGVIERLEDNFSVAAGAVRVRFQRIPILGGGGSGSAAAGEVAGSGPVVMSLESPSGQVIDPSTVDPDVTYQVGTDYEYYDIENPEPGLWTVVLDGASLPAGGEDEAVTATFVPQEAPDGDVDGVADSLDNCPSTYNPAQTDSDGNGVGDACQAVGGIAELPEVGETPLDTPGESGGNMGVLVGLAASSAAGLLTLGSAAWYARRRWQRR